MKERALRIRKEVPRQLKAMEKLRDNTEKSKEQCAASTLAHGRAKAELQVSQQPW
jgi:hypothetical protein